MLIIDVYETRTTRSSSEALCVQIELRSNEGVRRLRLDLVTNSITTFLRLVVQDYPLR